MLQPGTQIGRYEIQRRLGRGGMGTVYVAHDPVLGRMVAIKVFLTDLEVPDAAERFTREARSAAALNHANIVTIHDFGDYASQPYIVMEYVQGETLAEVIRRKAPVPLIDKVRWMEELCAGAAYAHRIGVIHRDIKPTNLMVDRSGRLKILDFGIAKMLGGFASNATALVGTPGYMAPEQILGGSIDHRSDLFAIGAVCYELFSGTEAFPGETVPAITHRILSEEPASLSTLGINADICAAVERAMKKAPADRFEDAEALRSTLARVRRQLEIEGPWDAAPTVLSARPSLVTNRPSTGAEKKPPAHTPGGSVELTPSPETQRADREALARRRTAQIEAALERARAALHRGDVDVAHDECLQALTLDDAHPVALELESAINLARDKRRAEALLEEARQVLGKRELTAAQGLLQQARALDPEGAEVKRLERDLRLARVEQERLRQRAEAVEKAVTAAEQALARKEIEAALAFARQALELQPDSEKARSVEAEAMRRLDEETGAQDASDLAAGIAPTMLSSLPGPRGAADVTAVADVAPPTVLVPPKRTSVAKPATPAAEAPTIKRPPAAKAPAKAPGPKRDSVGEIRARAAALQATFNAKPKQQKQIIAGVAAAVALVVVGVVMWSLIPARPPVTGVVMIDALPYAAVTGIEAADGTRPPVPAQAATPLALTLPVGTYRVRLVGPPPENESRLITVQVQADGTATPPVERFKALTVEQYFEPYLSSTSATPDQTGVPPAGPGSPATAQPAAAVPQGAPQQ